MDLDKLERLVINHPLLKTRGAATHGYPGERLAVARAIYARGANGATVPDVWRSLKYRFCPISVVANIFNCLVGAGAASRSGIKYWLQEHASVSNKRHTREVRG
jgi:hypothetical protein